MCERETATERERDIKKVCAREREEKYVCGRERERERGGERKGKPRKQIEELFLG